MKNLDFEWLTDEFLLYCRSTQLREKTMSSCEQTLHLFDHCFADERKSYIADKISEMQSAVASPNSNFQNLNRSESVDQMNYLTGEDTLHMLLWSIYFLAQNNIRLGNPAINKNRSNE